MAFFAETGLQASVAMRMKRSAMVDIALTNVVGLGAVQLAQSLLPALETAIDVGRIYLPDRGPLTFYTRCSPGPEPRLTIRRLPNSVSRFAECTVGGGRFDTDNPLLVLGDLPLRARARQFLFVQTPHVLKSLSTAAGADALKYRLSRAIFSANRGRVAGFIVQSDAMRSALTAEYGIDPDAIAVVRQPPPAWLLNATAGPQPAPSRNGLRLLYPAASYPHKNHALLAKVGPSAWRGLVDEMTITVEDAEHPNRQLQSIRAVGRLAPDAMLSAYRRADALVFLSRAESFGFPLVEAMWLGLPIVAPNLPYAHELCGPQVIYFDPLDAGSLHDALAKLKKRIDAGWRPDWRTQLASIPRDWAAVASAFTHIVAGAAHKLPVEVSTVATKVIA